MTNTDNKVSVDEWLAHARTLADGTVLSDERLHEVFDLVKPANNWKDPIDATVARSKASPEEIEKAVIWFAGGIPDMCDEPFGYLRVTGAGYYTWIGA